jgi:hypothetical protein
MSDSDDLDVPSGTFPEPPKTTGDDAGVRWLRGVLLVVGAFVLGALLLPSATRPPLSVGLASEASPATGSSSPSTSSASQGGSGPSAQATTTTATPSAVPGAASVHVLVANGTTITGLAAGVANYLRSRGFVTSPASNASTHVTATQVYAAGGQQSAAGTVVTALGLPAATVQPATAVAPVPSTGSAAVVVIAGPDLVRLAPGH